jgi:hypothetical protein
MRGLTIVLALTALAAAACTRELAPSSETATPAPAVEGAAMRNW